MRKLGTMLLIFAMLLLVVACKKTTEEDLYGNMPVEETSVSGTDETLLDDPTGDETNPEDTVSEEVYENDIDTESIDLTTVEVETGALAVDDPEFENALLSFLDPLYYNVFFGQGNYVEGIAEGDMTKFAVSYIYQHEYNELKFDTTNFILFVPEKRVEELVLRYFDYEVTGHHSFIDDNLMYEDGYYLMPAVDVGWDEKMSIHSVTTTGDHAYAVILELESESDETTTYKSVSIEIREDRYVLVSYTDTTEEEVSLSANEQAVSE